MAAKPTHIVDACALIAYFKEEEGHERLAELLADEENVLAIHATNLCEVYYGYLRCDGADRADEAWERAVEILGVIETLDLQFMKRVGRWKVNYTLGLADAFAAATAEASACPLITTDHTDFASIEAAGALEIAWLR
jgi:predicted nucleic acid-binding protein